jgi:hypothetical protein
MFVLMIYGSLTVMLSVGYKTVLNGVQRPFLSRRFENYV